MKKKMTMIDKLMYSISVSILILLAVAVTVGVFWFFGSLIAAIVRHTGLV